MRALLALFAVAGGIFAVAPRAEACSIRGQYCGYPSWAANAFEGRHGFKGNPAILTYNYVSKPARKPVRRYR